MRSLRVALVTLNSRQKDKAYNLEKMSKWVRCARRRDAELILFPELSITGWYTREDLQVAEPCPGSATDRLVEMARESDMFISAGLLEIEGGTIYGSTQVLSDPKASLEKPVKSTRLLETGATMLQGRIYLLSTSTA